MFWLRQYELTAISIDAEISELIQKSDIFVYISRSVAERISQYLGG